MLFGAYRRSVRHRHVILTFLSGQALAAVALHTQQPYLQHYPPSQSAKLQGISTFKLMPFQ
jgi:hypothetical protein